MPDVRDLGSAVRELQVRSRHRVQVFLIADREWYMIFVQLIIASDFMERRSQRHPRSSAISISTNIDGFRRHGASHHAYTAGSQIEIAFRMLCCFLRLFVKRERDGRRNSGIRIFPKKRARTIMTKPAHEEGATAKSCGSRDRHMGRCRSIEL